MRRRGENGAVESDHAGVELELEQRSPENGPTQTTMGEYRPPKMPTASSPTQSKDEGDVESTNLVRPLLLAWR